MRPRPSASSVRHIPAVLSASSVCNFGRPHFGKLLSTKLKIECPSSPWQTLGIVQYVHNKMIPSDSPFIPPWSYHRKSKHMALDGTYHKKILGDKPYGGFTSTQEKSEVTMDIQFLTWSREAYRSGDEQNCERKTQTKFVYQKDRRDVANAGG